MKWLLVLNGGQDFLSAVFLQDDCAEICFVNPKSHQHFTTAICILLSTISKECQVTRMKKSNKGKDKKKKRRKKEERKRRKEKQTVDRIEERKEEWHERKITKGKEERRRE